MHSVKKKYIYICLLHRPKNNVKGILKLSMNYFIKERTSQS